MRKALDKRPNNIQNQTLWTAILIGFFGFMRKANYTVEKAEYFDSDMDLTNGKLIKRNRRYGLRLSRTKTIQFGQRKLTIMLPRLDDEICPVLAIRKLQRMKRSTGKYEPLLVTDAQNKPMTKNWFERRFKALLKEIGINDKLYSPHSLRRGGATFALECGLDPVCIKLQGDWVSDAWMLYAWMSERLKLRTVRKFESYMK